MLQKRYKDHDVPVFGGGHCHHVRVHLLCWAYFASVGAALRCKELETYLGLQKSKCTSGVSAFDQFFFLFCILDSVVCFACPVLEAYSKTQRLHAEAHPKHQCLRVRGACAPSGPHTMREYPTNYFLLGMFTVAESWPQVTLDPK